MNTQKIKNATLFNFENCNSNEVVLIAGNAYGIMPYIEPLAKQLVEKKFNPFWFSFSGQEGNAGDYNFKQGVEDFSNIINYLKEQYSSDINILAHCAGSLITLEYLKETQNREIKNLAIYGLLYSMSRRRNVAERKLKNCGVKYNLSEQDWAYNPLNAIEKCQSNILFCHAKDKLNFERATEAEMELAVSHKTNSKIKWFEKGYDEDNTQIDNYINTYVSFLKEGK